MDRLASRSAVTSARPPMPSSDTAPRPIRAVPAPPSLRRGRRPFRPSTIAAIYALFTPQFETQDELAEAVDRVMEAVRQEIIHR
jgi:hypothetical protein